MIGVLTGTLIDRDDNLLTLLCGQVGYEVHCTQRACALGSSVGAVTDQTGPAIHLWTHLVVREDLMQLFGFVDRKERALFRELIRISGIGPKVALGLLSGMDADNLVAAIRRADSAALTKLPGIGKKTAERLVIEMQDRIKDWHSDTTLPGTAAGTESIKTTVSDHMGEAEAALISLGYKPTEASRMLTHIDGVESMSVEQIIRAALQSRVSS